MAETVSDEAERNPNQSNSIQYVSNMSEAYLSLCTIPDNLYLFDFDWLKTGQGKKNSIWFSQFKFIYSTFPHEQDVTQGQFLSEVKQV